MRIRESGMPEQDLWESFFDPEEILEQLGLSSKVRNVVEFGCGYGTFTLPAARRVSGTVYAVDLDPDMLAIVRQRAATEQLDNISLVQRDFMANGTGLGDSAAEVTAPPRNSNCSSSSRRRLRYQAVVIISPGREAQETTSMRGGTTACGNESEPSAAPSDSSLIPSRTFL